MDIFHTGREDAADDHKFVNERLLELAIPDENSDKQSVTLEDCLELFFNNKIEVKRYLDQLERRNTLSSIRSRRSVDSSKADSSHIEVAEVRNSSQPSTPTPLSPQDMANHILQRRPTLSRKRAPSIIQEHYISEKSEMLALSPSIDEKGEQFLPPGRVRKEVVMPAWQFFSLIPWYTNNMPSSDAQVAAHFSSTRPILGICLKRYSILPNGNAVKRTTHVDIPLEIGLPHFIQDDQMAEDGPAFGNFKLSLQSVVCHQGVSAESGHYVSLVRDPNPDRPDQDKWMRFDDLAAERITYTDVNTFLLEESPYLLFYQVIPIEHDPADNNPSIPPIFDGEEPPSYTESNQSLGSRIDSGRPSEENGRASSDISTSDDGRRGRSSTSSEREDTITHSSADIGIAGSARLDLLNAPNPDGPNSLTASRRGSKANDQSSKSRPPSQSDGRRLSNSLSRLASRMSRDRMNKSRENLVKTEPTPNLPSGYPIQEPSTSNPTFSQHSRAEPGRDARQSKDSSSTSKDFSSVALMAMRERGDASNDKLDRHRLKKEAKEKLKNGQRDYQHLMKGRRKEGKPDRECSVM